MEKAQHPKLYNLYPVIGQLMFLRWAEIQSDRPCLWYWDKIMRMTAPDEWLMPEQVKRVFWCWNVIDEDLNDKADR